MFFQNILGLATMSVDNMLALTRNTACALACDSRGCVRVGELHGCVLGKVLNSRKRGCTHELLPAVVTTVYEVLNGRAGIGHNFRGEAIPQSVAKFPPMVRVSSWKPASILKHLHCRRLVQLPMVQDDHAITQEVRLERSARPSLGTRIKDSGFVHQFDGVALFQHALAVFLVRDVTGFKVGRTVANHRNAQVGIFRVLASAGVRSYVFQ